MSPSLPRRASQLLTAPPPVVGAGGATVVVVAYKDGGPRIFNADGTMGSALSDGTTLATTGQDLVVVLPGRAYVPALETSDGIGQGHVPAASQTAGAGVYVNDQTTPLRRLHGAQIKSTGRHVVCIGGQIDMAADYHVTTPLEQTNRSLYVVGGPTGNVHLEGIEGTGDWQYEFFNASTATSAILAWQNMAVRKALGADGQTVSVRYIPIDAPAPGNHSGGDVIQTITMPRGIVIDGHIDEAATFQSIFLKAETGQTRPDFVFITNYVSANYHGPGPWLYLMPDPNGDICPHVRLGSVWMQPAAMFGPNDDYTAAVPRADGSQTSLANNVWPQTGQTIGTAADGQPTLTESDWQDVNGSGAAGLARTLDPAVAVTDDMALSGTPGMGYTTPGYRLAAAPTSTTDMAAAETPIAVEWRIFTRSPFTPPPHKPTAPFGLTQIARTSTTLTPGWSEDADSSVTGHHVYTDGNLADSIGASARQDLIDGLTPDTDYSITVSRFNADLESDQSTPVVMRTLPASTSTTTLMGSSLQNNNPGGYTQWDVVRSYRVAAANGQISQYKPKIIALSDDPNVPDTGGQASADKLRTALNNIFAQHPNVEVHYGNGNEIDRESPNFTNLKATFAAMRVVIDDFVANGFKASLWIDLTQNNIRDAIKAGNYETNFKNAAAQYIDGIAVSFYPPGRLQTTTDPTFTDYSVFVDPCFDLAEDWGITKVSCWETGIPIDPNAKQHRPTYIAGLAQHIVNQGAQRGIDVPALIYWDNWSSPQTSQHPNNQFSADPNGTSPNTADSWRFWPDHV